MLIAIFVGICYLAAILLTVRMLALQEVETKKVTMQEVAYFPIHGTHDKSKLFLHTSPFMARKLRYLFLQFHSCYHSGSPI